MKRTGFWMMLLLPVLPLSVVWAQGGAGQIAPSADAIQQAKQIHQQKLQDIPKHDMSLLAQKYHVWKKAQRVEEQREQQSRAKSLYGEKATRYGVQGQWHHNCPYGDTVQQHASAPERAKRAHTAKQQTLRECPMAHHEDCAPESGR